MKEIPVKPCSCGANCSASIDIDDGAIVIWDNGGTALGHFYLDDVLKLKEEGDKPDEFGRHAEEPEIFTDKNGDIVCRKEWI